MIVVLSGRATVPAPPEPRPLPPDPERPFPVPPEPPPVPPEPPPVPPDPEPLPQPDPGQSLDRPEPKGRGTSARGDR